MQSSYLLEEKKLCVGNMGSMAAKGMQMSVGMYTVVALGRVSGAKCVKSEVNAAKN